jgi:hypothetical protein
MMLLDAYIDASKKTGTYLISWLGSCVIRAEGLFMSIASDPIMRHPASRTQELNAIGKVQDYASNS